jgi:hypothetical protein
MLRPNHTDPLGQRKEELGISLIDQIINELDVMECIELALKKLISDKNTREVNIVITKLEEAQLWLKQDYLKNKRTLI